MSRSWAELLGDEAAAPDPSEEGTGLFARLRDSLGKSRRALTEEIAVAAFDPGDSASWERLEEALIAADVGVPATAELVRRLEARATRRISARRSQEEIASLLGEPATAGRSARAPSVILVVGVNGTGKTTTIGKLAAKLDEHGRSVLRRRRRHLPRRRRGAARDLGAARATRTSSAPTRGGDPAAVAFDAIEAARVARPRRRRSSTPPAACTRRRT